MDLRIDSLVYWWEAAQNSSNGHPDTGKPVLALIESVNDLGISRFREVVYHDGELWCSYEGSRTFEDGERVLKWIYADECI